MAEGPKTFAEAIDAIEETYEFMLAYAAQGRRNEEEEAGSGIRERLTLAEVALGIIAAATIDAIATADAQAIAASEFLDVVKADAGRARAAFRLVLAQRSIGFAAQYPARETRICCARMRAIVSVGPPAAAPTIIVIGRAG
jgi:hypothetical protein